MHPVGRKIAAWTLSVLLAVGVLFSAWFLAREIRHACTGQSCPVCACLQAAARQLKNGAGPAAHAAAVCSAVFGAVLLSGGAVQYLPGTTPVACKVRLDN